jgi:hypothetical protein
MTMNTSIPTRTSLSFRYVGGVAAMALMTMLGACDKKTDGVTSAASGSDTTTSAAAKKPKTTLKLAELQSAYKAEIDNMSKMKDPMDKKVDAFVAKVGKPASDSGRKKVWYALDGEKCTKVEVDGKDGSITEASTDKGDCGL